MAKYASTTSVSSFKSREEIEKILKKYGSDQFYYGTDADNSYLAFRMDNRQIKFILPMPNFDDFTKTPKGKLRAFASQEKEYEQAIRQKWRALALVIKAKLEAVDSGITEFEDEFLANIVLPDGSTAGEYMKPQIEIAYNSGNMPALLEDYSKKRKRK